MADLFWTPEHLEEMVSARSRILGPQVWAAATPDPRHLISFAGGLPDIPSLPGEQLLRAARAVIEREQKEALEYGGTFGPLPLRDAIAERSSRIEGIPLTRDNVIIASGSAHAIGMVCETLLDPGDVVMVESPNFPGSMRTIRSFGATQVAIPMDEQGMRCDILEDELQKLADQGKRAKFIYCIPTHQNPAGCTLQLDRREKLLELARRFNTFVLEDDAYGELWFEQTPPPSVFALSNGDHGIKVSSFSKIIATGLRMGWIMGPPALISRVAALRYDMGSSPFLGRVIAEMMRNGDLDRHIENLRGIYLRKLERVEDALARYTAPYATYTRPLGGFFLWLQLRPGLNSRDVQMAANEKGVVVGQGPQFFADGNATNHIRLAFSYVAMEEIEEGIHRLGEAMAEVAARTAAK
ncbi:MAG: PLP-dependent aminotransferase family protein [Dehalococcoidia bacterium]|jgi:2-aminoadipate transaminase|uniref:aminotransferase-like domain-containing protein n=2 Tax=Candidatus Amarobacter glycogenicus TaxID=3140699 RepID=UPI001DCA514D|nr:PLP-dependent aminotransferase family protein [Dehalococcoidia bacterium]MBK7125507.1 PLP-dependent aminotransferase family protein [Dehalococcoidia bacterium]MBK7726032.1 PLP-dependent aminotransferase family protein [Dehalococcoidia bacterium]MBK8559077.1 PLP-dependent aminotransferase family protein [Dehalococcoidia bacterium]MBK9343506.1 PLP-dependent aminotransferase family protein [Dehalococcoidia bacterium]